EVSSAQQLAAPWVEQSPRGQIGVKDHECTIIGQHADRLVTDETGIVGQVCAAPEHAPVARIERRHDLMRLKNAVLRTKGPQLRLFSGSMRLWRSRPQNAPFEQGEAVDVSLPDNRNK